METTNRLEIFRGTLDLLILKTLLDGSMHGYTIANRIQCASEDMLRVEEGVLYPALHRMEHRGWIKSKWGVSENNRRAKFYALTIRGKAQLRKEESNWSSYCAAVGRVLRAAGDGA